MSGLRRSGKTGNRYYAELGRIMLVFFEIRRPQKLQRTVFEIGNCPVAAGRLVFGRGGTRCFTSSIRPILDESVCRFGVFINFRAVYQIAVGGDGIGRRACEDEQVGGKYYQSGRDCGYVWRRYVKDLRNVHGAVESGDCLEHAGGSRKLPVSGAGLPAGADRRRQNW